MATCMDASRASSKRRTRHPPALDSVTGVLQEALPRQPDGLGNGLVGNSSLPLLHNGVPRQAALHLLQHVRNEDPGSPKRQLAVTHPWVGDDVASVVPGVWGRGGVLRGFPGWHGMLDLIHSFAQLAGRNQIALRRELGAQPAGVS